MKAALLIGACAIFILAGGGAAAAVARKPSACVVPRLFASAPAVAKDRLVAAGCRLGTVAFERPRAANPRVTGQVPAAGAVLPSRTRVALVVS